MPYKREPEFVEISPKALIPAVRIGDRGFCESLIVVEFIDEFFNGPKLLLGDCIDRAQQRQIVDHGNCFKDKPASTFYSASKEIFPNHFKIISSQEESVREESVTRVGTALSQLIRAADGNSVYFRGDLPGYIEGPRDYFLITYKN